MIEETSEPADEWAEQGASWRAAISIDLQATMALARASTTALLGLSPLAHRGVSEALANEIAALEDRGDVSGAAAAQLVRQYISSDFA